MKTEQREKLITIKRNLQDLCDEVHDDILERYKIHPHITTEVQELHDKHSHMLLALDLLREI